MNYFNISWLDLTLNARTDIEQMVEEGVRGDKKLMKRIRARVEEKRANSRTALPRHQLMELYVDAYVSELIRKRFRAKGEV